VNGLVWLNGDLVTADVPAVPLLDRGYLYGEGLFETMRAYDGRVFALDRHLRRLLSSAAELGLELEVGEEQLARALGLTLEANSLRDAYLRLTVSQRCDAPGIESRARGRFSVSVIARPLDQSPRRAKAATVVTLDAGSAPPASVARHKTLSFLPYVAARAEAHARGADDALLLNAAGEITEASTANVFLVIGGRLVTPPVACGLLPGITRAIVLDLARDAGIEVAERPIRPADLGAGAESFLTNSIVELAPVASINGASLSSGAAHGMGAVTAALAASYRRAVAKTTAA
jgi:branched-subunit amino acid aminotransferase/4-amino-4-deoxychorismate lyase